MIIFLALGITMCGYSVRNAQKNTDLIHPEEYEVGNWSSFKMNKIKLKIEQMFDIIITGSLPGVILILLNRPINIYPGIGGVNDNGT